MTKRGFLKRLTAGTLAGIPAVKAVEVLSVRPQDIVVITFPDRISQEVADQIKGVWSQQFPETKALVMGDGGEIKVLRGDA